MSFNFPKKKKKKLTPKQQCRYAANRFRLQPATKTSEEEKNQGAEVVEEGSSCLFTSSLDVFYSRSYVLQ